MSDPAMAIALLSQAGESGRHLRDALAESGTPIVYESRAADLDRDALEQSGARVVVVNLDPEVEAHLDEVYALLDDDRYNVIFDESQVSSQLSGWEQARWARNLASKILGVENSDPPRPQGAEPVPLHVVAAEAPISKLDLSEFDDIYEPGAPPLGAFDNFADPVAITTDDSEKGIELELADRELDIDEPNSSVFSDDDALGFGDLDDFAGELSTPIEEIVIDASVMPATSSVVSDLADAVKNGEAAASGIDLEDLQLDDLDWSEAPPLVTSSAEESDEEIAEQDPKVTLLGSAFAVELGDPDEDAGSESSSVDAIPAKASEFGIETVSASDYLAPEADDNDEEDDDSGISLELIPLEEAVLPGGAPTESWLDTNNKTAVSRVWVLGASIGGPEAVREFLADIPANCPALFLLAQHMGAEFMEIMAQQLTRSTKLTVRTPAHGERVAHGDLLIVPTTHRMRIDRAGVVTLEAQPVSERSNLPSIDQVLADVADRFGAKSGAIIFSGMAEDAAEGARYLTEIGGVVYVQDPETCIISSMVDGVMETGVVSFVGSPKELARKLLGELSNSAKT